MKLINRLVMLYRDYRKNIPSIASSSLAFYMIFLLVPSITLLAIGVSFFQLDLTYLQKLLEVFLIQEYVDFIIKILYSNTVNSVALLSIVISLMTVSKGVGNIYRISKRMFYTAEESIIDYYLYILKITVLLFAICISFLFVFAIKPLTFVFDFLYAILEIRHILLYFSIVYFLTFVYKVVPRSKIKYEDAFKGALLASALMVVLFYGLQIYFHFVDFQSLYGPLASIIAILFVFNLSAEVFYIGMYVTYKFYLRRLVG